MNIIFKWTHKHLWLKNCNLDSLIRHHSWSLNSLGENIQRQLYQYEYGTEWAEEPKNKRHRKGIFFTFWFIFKHSQMFWIIENSLEITVF
jgi:hypothetical protein